MEKEVSNILKKLINKELIDYIGSDIHSLNQIDAINSLKINDFDLKSINDIFTRTNKVFNN